MNDVLRLTRQMWCLLEPVHALLSYAPEAIDGAATSDLPWSDAPHLALRQPATVLHEHRGDGHIAALAATGLDPCESLVSLAAVGAPRRSLRQQGLGR